MRILAYAGEGGSGGLKTYIKGFISSLIDFPNVSVVLLCTESCRLYIQDIVPSNVKVVVAKSLKKNYIHKLSKDLINSFKPNIVYYLSSNMVFYHREAFNVFTMHNQLYFDRHQLYRQGLTRTTFALLRKKMKVIGFLKKADYIIFDSNNSKLETMKNVKGIKNADVSYFGVEECERASKLKDDFEISKKIKFIYISTLFPYKNHLELLDCLHLLKVRGYDFSVDFVGNGPEIYKKKIISKISKLGLENNINLLDWVPHKDVQGLIDQADVFLYASSIETSGLGILEGMARNCVILCHRASCMPEVLQDGGLYFDVFKPNTFLDSFERIIDSKELRLELSKKAYSLGTNFTWHNHTAKIISIFQKCLELKDRPE